MEPFGQSLLFRRKETGAKVVKKYYKITYFASLMIKINVLLSMVMVALLASCNNQRSGKPRVLVFSKTITFRHSSIPSGQAAIMKLGAENGFLVDTTENAAYFNDDSLRNYSAVIFLNTADTKDSLLNHYEKNAFERYIQAGGGFVGVHAASDAGYHWGWYKRLVGANFNGHPEQQDAILHVLDHKNPSTKHLPAEWKRKDEWYNFKDFNKNVNVLINIDEKSYSGGTNGDSHPMAWYHEYDGGRAFYTGLGHTEESYVEENFLQHLLGGIQYAIGKNKVLDYSKAKTLKTPNEEQFAKTLLHMGQLDEPVEMGILPNLNIIIAQRRGKIWLYKQGDTILHEAAHLNVYHQTDTPNVNSEEGLLGIQVDPDFKKNNFIYVYYAPGDTSVNRLSRFVLNNDKIDISSEKIIIQFYTQRDICCHTGGSIAFGNDRMLYLSTGDNTTPFNEAGEKFLNNSYAPIDDRQGHEQYDARRSSANTNDLRGKIIRIKMLEDGTYEIPDGNLFPQGLEKTRPEIYVMGNRNPYRISIDKKTGFLYWGEVGPDANTDSIIRGPRGYDEVNQARKAGFFGWPLFVGNNYAYREYNFMNGDTGKFFNPSHPVNTSRNNTGLTELPPAVPAFIYYPYASSDEFPQLGAGGRNAMAGPVLYNGTDKTIPAYYDGKLLIYDWIRGWIKAVTMTPSGDLDNIEPFMPSTKFNSIIDMEMGPDGKLYILEYGNGWFTKNSDAALSRVDYDPNMKAQNKSSIAIKNPAAIDSAEFKVGHQVIGDSVKGKNIMETLDCKACHKTDEKSIGPSFTDIAAKYDAKKDVISYLSGKIINGSQGVWGETAMPAHPALPQNEADLISKWIISLKK